MIRVLIVDDHQVVREGLRQVVRQGPELYVVGEAVDGTETIGNIRQLYPDGVLMDLVLPKLDGLAATTIIRQEMSGTHVLVMYGRLGVQSRAQAILTTMLLSLVSSEASATKGTHFLPSRRPGVLERKEKR